jgi:hypothetical protein
MRRGVGVPARVARRELGPLFPSVLVREDRSLLRTLRRGHRSSHTCSAHPWGLHHLSRGRILKGFAPNPSHLLCPRPHRTAGPTLENGRAGRRGFLHGWLDENWALCSHRFWSGSIGRYRRDKTRGFPWTLFWQALLALALAGTTLCLLCHFYRYGEMPTFLRPLSEVSK